jgi:hypothetical protein
MVQYKGKFPISSLNIYIATIVKNNKKGILSLMVVLIAINLIKKRISKDKTMKEI